MTAANMDPLLDLASLDFLRSHCCSCLGGASDCAATDDDKNNDAMSSSDVVGIFIDVVMGSLMILIRLERSLSSSTGGDAQGTSP